MTDPLLGAPNLIELFDRDILCHCGCGTRIAAHGPTNKGVSRLFVKGHHSTAPGFRRLVEWMKNHHAEIAGGELTAALRYATGALNRAITMNELGAAFAIAHWFIVPLPAFRIAELNAVRGPKKPAPSRDWIKEDIRPRTARQRRQHAA